ncbi:TrmH family RNA methyltransferase [Flindersiella endophytica]
MPSYEMAVLEGALSVQATLDSGHRQVHQILATTEAMRTPVVRLARRRGIPVRHQHRKDIERLTTGSSHGGVVAVVGPRRYQSLADVTAGEPFLALLDGIEDPYNFGQAIRALYAAGADGLLLRTDHRPHAEAIVARASAGASERMKTVLVAERDETLAALRARGVRLVCSQPAGRGGISCHTADLSGPLLLVIGGERRGIARDLAAQADLLVTIPYGRRFTAALDATSATAALAFEVARQRRAKRHEGASPLHSPT